MKTIESLAALLRDRDRDNDHRYFDLVRRVCDGEDVDPGAAARVLDAAGRSVEDLAASVALLSRRRRLADEVAEAEAMRGEEAGLARQIAAAKAELEAAQARYHAAVAPLRHRAEEVQAAVTRTFGHGKELADTCPYGDKVQAHKDAEAARLAAALRRDALRVEIERGREALAQLEWEFARQKAGTDRAGVKVLRLVTPGEAAGWQKAMGDMDESIQRRKSRIAEQEQQLVELCLAADRLAAVAEAARRELLTP